MNFGIVALFHGGVIGHHVFSLIYSDNLDLSQSTDQRVLEMKTFAMKYFTTWNMFIQLLYFIMALGVDCMEKWDILKNFKDKLKVIKADVFATLISSTLFVSIFFWTLYHIDRDLVLPRAADAFVPAWLNHTVHTNVAIFLIIEILLTKQVMPKFRNGLILVTILNIVYDFTLCYTYYESGRWIYRVFYLFNWTERIAFMMLYYVACVGFLKLGLEMLKRKNMWKLEYKTH